MLEQQRSFRIEQLAQLDAELASSVPGAARLAVNVALRAAAESALADIDLALRRMGQGQYGTCVECADTLAEDRLRALPMAPRCERCQRVHDAPAARAPRNAGSS